MLCRFSQCYHISQYRNNKSHLLTLLPVSQKENWEAVKITGADASFPKFLISLKAQILSLITILSVFSLEVTGLLHWIFKKMSATYSSPAVLWLPFPQVEWCSVRGGIPGLTAGLAGASSTQSTQRAVELHASHLITRLAERPQCKGWTLIKLVILLLYHSCFSFCEYIVVKMYSDH